MRRFVILVVAVALLAGASCTGDDEDSSGDGPPNAGPSAETAGLVPEADWRERQDDYLAFAAAGKPDLGSPLSLMAHAEASLRAGADPESTTEAMPSDFEPIFQKLIEFRDTGDFDVNRLITLWVKYREHLSPELADAIEERILAFKYWWTEPTPEGVVDSQYYWTENHQIIFLANEYIAGQTWPDTEFTNSGMTGDEHVAHAAERLRKWFDWRARFGFSEWLSNVYWIEDMKGVLLLAELSEDPEIARLASMTLDVMFIELAGHVQRGNFGSTHGRSYQKDKLNGRDDDTYSLVKMVFDETPADYESADSATLLAVASQYRPPEVARRIASSDETVVFRTKSSLPLDPNAPVDPDVEAPYGLTFEGEDGLMLWWGMGAQFPWQMVPTSVETVLEYDLFETANFQQAADLAPIIETSDLDSLRTLASSLAKQVNPGLLSQVDTYTWRSPEIMLSTAQDWRPGQRGEQTHIWQATIDPDALVFTQHPRTGVSPIDDARDNNSYWTGDGAIPRSAQHENVNISIYSPQYEGDGGVGSGAYSFTYLDYTHAFFPTEHFDEIVEQDGWVIGRKGDAYVALWSHRPTEWRTYDTETEFTRGLTERFDLMAPGGPDNVWITEVGTADDYVGNADPFESFVNAITASAITVERSDDPMAGATVSYLSPSQGQVSFGWLPKDEAEPLPPLVVDGEEIDLHPEDVRWDAPYATASFDGDLVYRAELGGAMMEIDFGAGTRVTAIE